MRQACCCGATFAVVSIDYLRHIDRSGLRPDMKRTLAMAQA
jgi:hypothetical protein